MKTLYQLRANGNMKSFNRRHTFFSQKVFASREGAEKYTPEFRGLVTGDRIADLVDDADLDIGVIELTLVED
jgi:hypothetical protein